MVVEVSPAVVVVHVFVHVVVVLVSAVDAYGLILYLAEAFVCNMGDNAKLFEKGRELQKHRDLDKRVALMARVASIRDSIRQYQTTLLQLEAELALENEKFRNASQISLGFEHTQNDALPVGRVSKV